MKNSINKDNLWSNYSTDVRESLNIERLKHVNKENFWFKRGIFFVLQWCDDINE